MAPLLQSSEKPANSGARTPGARLPGPARVDRLASGWQATSKVRALSVPRSDSIDRGQCIVHHAPTTRRTQYAKIVRCGPLRVVIGDVWLPAAVNIPSLRRLELLACAHAQRPVFDVFCASQAERRRCACCKLGTPPLPQLVDQVAAWAAGDQLEAIYDSDPLKTGWPGLSDR